MKALQLNDRFTPREKQALEYILLGLAEKEIALNLGLAERGAKYHIRNILRKTGKRTRRDLLAGAIEEFRRAVV